jgi:hypothetical protein
MLKYLKQLKIKIMRKNVAQLTKELQKTNKIIKFYKYELDELEYAYSISKKENGIPDDIHYKHQDLILNYINKRDELQSELNSIKNKHE